MKFNLSKNQLEPLPSPDKLNTESGLSMWEIKSIKDDCIYRIWANSYKEALEMLPQIESF
jgi:hypothetical protein